jgi:hypothetical protein
MRGGPCSKGLDDIDMPVRTDLSGAVTPRRTESALQNMPSNCTHLLHLGSIGHS